MATVLVDMDGIVADMLGKLLEDYNKQWKDDLQPEDIKSFNFHEHVKPEAKESVNDIYHQEGHYLELDPIPGAIETVAGWRKSGIDVMFCSSPPTPHGAAEKYIWIDKHFGPHGFDRKDIILATKKHHVYGDILIDDRPRNAVDYKEAWPQSKVITIGYRYNFNCPAYDLIAGDYRFPEYSWKKIDEFVRGVAG